MEETWNDFEQFLAANDRWIWIVLGIALGMIVLAIVAGFAKAKKRERDRGSAAEIREHAAIQQAERLEHGRRVETTNRH